MELDEFKALWREVNRETVFELKLSRARTALRGLAGILVFELVSGVLAMMLVGAFLAEHILVARFAAPAIVLQAVALLTVVTSVRQLAMLGRVDYAARVVGIQRQLGELKALRTRVTQLL